MKAKAEAGAAAAAAERLCPHCKRPVAAPNFALHEAHCRRFLALCPRCEERLPAATLHEHLSQAHRQVRCPLCHRRMQQFQLERHQAEECPERRATCAFCQLELPLRLLRAHLDACGCRTTECWDCRQYVMFRALDEHRRACPAREELQRPAPVAPRSQRQDTAQQDLPHPNECHPFPGAASAIAPAKSGSSARREAVPGPSSCLVRNSERDIHPKRQDRELASVGQLSLKRPRGKKAPGHLAFTAGPQALEASANDQLVTCTKCNILLPGPTLKKHEKNCRRVTSLQTLRRSPRHSDKGEKSL